MASKAKSNGPLSHLPSMTELLDAAQHHPQLARIDRALLTEHLRRAVAAQREALLAGTPTRVNDASAPTADIALLLAMAVATLTDESQRSLRRVINATGIVLHTGLGRAPLAPSAIDAVTQAAGYCNLEFNLSDGQRGRRGDHVETLLRRLTGAEAALIVNNNAAATMLVLAALAHDREVVISRGQLIEIGGSYRLPDVMACSGCVMREIGTTNKTHLNDYRDAIGDNTAMLLRVHPSNYRVQGFTDTPDIAAITELAHAHGLIAYDDLGSGQLQPDTLSIAADEPSVADSIKAGADVISFSGDKLLGGPQAGLIVGTTACIERLRQHPMTRALRVDKLTLAALEATLQIHLTPDRVDVDIPVRAMLKQPLDVLQRRAETLSRQLQSINSIKVDMQQSESFAGGGSLPAWPLPTWIVRVQPPAGTSAASMAGALRLCSPALVARVSDNAVVFDVRTLCDDQIADVCTCLKMVV